MSYQHPSWRDPDEPYFDDRKVIAHCTYCGCDIHAESEKFYADEAYQYDGDWCCEDCKDKFLEKFKVG